VKRLSLTLWFLLLALAAAGAGWWWLSRESKLVVATRHVDLYAPLTARDVAVKPVPRFGRPDGALEATGGAVGHYALHALGRGRVLSDGDVGPAVEAGAVVIPIEVKNGGDVTSGQRVDLVLAPSGDDVAPVVVPDVLVVDVREGDGTPVIAISVPRAQKRAVASVLARGSAILAR
jgi:hypothetical protein